MGQGAVGYEYLTENIKGGVAMPNYESCLSCNFYDEFDDVCKMGHLCCKGEMWPVSNRLKSSTSLMVKGISNTYEWRVGNYPKCGGTGKDNATLDWKCYICNGLGKIKNIEHDD